MSFNNANCVYELRGRVFGRFPNHNSSFSNYTIEAAAATEAFASLRSIVVATTDFPRQEFHEVWLIERTIMGGALAQMPDWEESTNEQPQFY